MKPAQLVGFLLWRLGLLILVVYGFFRGIDLALAMLDLPTQLDVGLGLALTGAGRVAASSMAWRGDSCDAGIPQ